jgi:dephospho-CoA kinase
MLKVGLTGSIAVGKSFVCSVFEELGCRVLDADVTARDVVMPGTVGLKEIVRIFGPGVLTSSGQLDRKKLAATVFADKAQRAVLNSIVHPLVIEAQDEWIRRQEREDPDGIAIIDAALMIESGGYKRFDELIVVFCDPDVQLSRLMLRQGISEAEAKLRIAAQMPQEEKKQYADFLIDTSNGFDDTKRQITEIYNQLRLLVSKVS